MVRKTIKNEIDKRVTGMESIFDEIKSEIFGLGMTDVSDSSDDDQSFTGHQEIITGPDPKLEEKIKL